ncbi:hypothetical protein BU17DRAFT_60472 [Hysterangium stoloniferum]|nr:hypothetical protein BU17DRAFT_60472 [Hysterangium stoloniferum]
MLSQAHYSYPSPHDVRFDYPYSQPSCSMLEQGNGTDSDPESWTDRSLISVRKAAIFDTQPIRPIAERWDSSIHTYHGRALPDRHTQEDFSDSSDRSTHVWVQRSQVTTSKALNHLVLEFSTNGVRSFFCGWTGCKHPVGFAQKPQLITHIRSAHLQEKPFVCTTCNTQFSRKQEASRHVLSMNSGRKYKCSGCHQAFSRKNYRDTHEESCLHSPAQYGSEAA